MGAKLDGFDDKLKALGKKTDRGGSDEKVWDAVRVLQAKVDALEQGRVSGGQQIAEPFVKDPAAGAKRIAELRERIFADKATEEEHAEFWALLREQPQILTDLLKAGETDVADHPNDKEAHRRLARLYTAKLMTVPDGPEKGLWSMKGIAQEQAILKIDPDDIGAHVAIGMHYSFWPEQFNKRADAIKEFEAARKIQETRTPEPDFANTYLQLRNLYLKEGKTKEAADVLDEGLRRFPDDAELKKAKEGAK
jgi:tetratricopeptide (TPR) repeat protein